MASFENMHVVTDKLNYMIIKLHYGKHDYSYRNLREIGFRLARSSFRGQDTRDGHTILYKNGRVAFDLQKILKNSDDIIYYTGLEVSPRPSEYIFKTL